MLVADTFIPQMLLGLAVLWSWSWSRDPIDIIWSSWSLMVQLFKKVIKFFVLFYFLTFVEGNESVARKVFFGIRDRVSFVFYF